MTTRKEFVERKGRERYQRIAGYNVTRKDAENGGNLAKVYSSERAIRLLQIDDNFIRVN